MDFLTLNHTVFNFFYLIIFDILERVFSYNILYIYFHYNTFYYVLNTVTIWPLSFHFTLLESPVYHYKVYYHENSIVNLRKITPFILSKDAEWLNQHSTNIFPIMIIRYANIERQKILILLMLKKYVNLIKTYIIFVSTFFCIYYFF